MSKVKKCNCGKKGKEWVIVNYRKKTALSINFCIKCEPKTENKEIYKV